MPFPFHTTPITSMCDWYLLTGISNVKSMCLNFRAYYYLCRPVFSLNNSDKHSEVGTLSVFSPGCVSPLEAVGLSMFTFW